MAVQSTIEYEANRQNEKKKKRKQFQQTRKEIIVSLGKYSPGNDIRLRSICSKD